MQRHRDAQHEESYVWSDRWVSTGYVFTKRDGRPLYPEEINVAFNRLIGLAGLPRIRFHDLRHTSASLALAAGVQMKVVSERLGHSTTGITADLYTHVSPAVAHAAADAIAAIVPLDTEC
jgi:integrase